MLDSGATIQVICFFTDRLVYRCQLVGWVYCEFLESLITTQEPGMIPSFPVSSFNEKMDHSYMRKVL